jgi:hypothetical protein
MACALSTGHSEISISAAAPIAEPQNGVFEWWCNADMISSHETALANEADGLRRQYVALGKYFQQTASKR